MGIEDRIRAANAGELGLQFIGPKGEVAAAFLRNSTVSGTRASVASVGRQIKLVSR